MQVNLILVPHFQQLQTKTNEMDETNTTTTIGSILTWLDTYQLVESIEPVVLPCFCCPQSQLFQTISTKTEPDLNNHMIEWFEAKAQLTYNEW